ncbi:DUF3992 domain-containing protein [Anaeromicrobium sediminis]|uniref:DUF3992 domain-containing protein n=1 Tax=Anaeromicrobium sediminis TaxID=1478221 RepID=UPI001595DE35|nr:S-Ena type endospore appendage [Anaeromicrobium sediminis]
MGICSPRERVTNLIKKCFTPDCGENEIIWMANGLVNPCATIVFNFTKACSAGGTIQITLTRNNGTTRVITLNQGESRAITIDGIDEIEVMCSGNADQGTCAINMCMIIHYDRC